MIADPEGRNVQMAGSLDARNRPTWIGQTPKGFRFKINTSNGTFSGSLAVEPGAKPSSFHGILVSPTGVDLGLGTPVWGGGFVSTRDGSLPLEILPLARRSLPASIYNRKSVRTIEVTLRQSAAPRGLVPHSILMRPLMPGRKASSGFSMATRAR